MTVARAQRRTISAVLALLLAASLLALLPVAPPAALAADGTGPAKLADFQGGVPDGFFVDNGGASSVTSATITVADTDPLARPGQAGDNDILEVGFSIGDYGVFGASYVIPGPRDWSTTDGFSFWFYGTGSGLTYQAEISENRSDPAIDTSERWDYAFIDDTVGWQQISIPWGDFTRATDFQPGGAPDDGLALTEIWAWAIVLPGGSDTVYFDDVALVPIIVDDFEAPLASGVDGDGVDIGFYTFEDDGDTTIAFSRTNTAPALPGSAGATNVLQIDADVTAFAGVIHGFENDTVDTWVSQDWSDNAGLAMWVYGNNSGTDLFIDLLENRNEGSTTDDAQRWTVAFKDDFTGWQYFEFPFADFTFKGIGNGAPNDGPTLTLEEVHGWAFGMLGTGGPLTFYIDDVSLYGVADIAELAVTFGAGDFEIPEGTTGQVSVKLTRSLGEAGDPAQVSVDYTVETIHAVEGRDFIAPATGTLTFIDGGSIEQFIEIEALDDTKYEDTERLILRLTNPVDIALGGVFQASASIINDDPYDPRLLDDFERAPDMWDTAGDLSLATPEIASDDPEALPDQSGYEHVLEVSTPLLVDIAIEGEVCVTAQDRLASIAADLEPWDDNWAVVWAIFDINRALADHYWENGDILDPRWGTYAFYRTAGAVQRLESIEELDPAIGAAIEGLTLEARGLAAGAIDTAIAGGGTLRYASLAQRYLDMGDAWAAGDYGDDRKDTRATMYYRFAWFIAIKALGTNPDQGVPAVQVVLFSTDGFDALTVDPASVTFGGATAIWDEPHEQDVNEDGDADLVFYFPKADLPCDPSTVSLMGQTFGGQSITSGGEAIAFGRDFSIGEDWTDNEALTFWYYGQGTGDEITVDLLDNRAPDPGPAGWSLVWSDEFNDPAGTSPNPENWGYELGDGTVNGIPGWGNSELQYYTDSPDNVSTDGTGNLVITARAADGSVDCYYGPCEYTSARLISWHKAEFAYGRIEANVQVPGGDAGLWPAFWSLGTDIDRVGWPQTGEIDIMEYVSRVPDEIFGTIHGPGYSGGASFGDTFGFPGGVYPEFHEFAIEWQPDRIDWYVDGNLYHTAGPADVAPNEWVFNDPVYLLLNLAIGGNFGGPVADTLTFPQEMKIDYVRVYQGPDTAERFEASFVDDTAGWRQVVVPFESFTRSADQPAGAPDDGLGLAEVWGYGFRLPEGGTTGGSLVIDQVRVEPLPAPTEIVVTNLNNAGDGSLRDALERIADGGTITFDPALAGGTIGLTTGPYVIGRPVTIDGADAPGIIVSGGGIDRVLIVDPEVTVAVHHLTMTGGYGWQLAGCVLNNGNLTLDHVTVTGCTMATDAGDFWQGGGGIYTGGNATLGLIDSTVSDNVSGWSGGGVYGFFDSTTTITRSTISGNTSTDVGGGMRSLGDATIVNSTFSGNNAIGWYGGAVFITDGVVDMTNVTIAGNVSNAGAPAAVFVGTFGDASATLNVINTIVSDNYGGCFLAPWGAGPVAINSLGSNVFQDGTCFPVGSDQIVGDAGIGSLADNGGPTHTHALLPGSPAIDMADGGVCPATDQRGIARPQGGGCDVGAFEFEVANG
jgi:beta-glucanase (GH16 family)